MKVDVCRPKPVTPPPAIVTIVMTEEEAKLLSELTGSLSLNNFKHDIGFDAEKSERLREFVGTVFQALHDQNIYSDR